MHLPMLFDGDTINPVVDTPRLTGQWLDVFRVMQDGRWRTLREISAWTGHPEASVSARLRDFRKDKFGGHRVERRRRMDRAGLHEYRLIVEGDE